MAFEGIALTFLVDSEAKIGCWFASHLPQTASASALCVVNSRAGCKPNSGNNLKHNERSLAEWRILIGAVGSGLTVELVLMLSVEVIHGPSYHIKQRRFS
jgi:hypothetical protein